MRFAFVVVLLVATAACDRPPRESGAKTTQRPAMADAAKTRRTVYPYSIVPGGVQTRDDVRGAMTAGSGVAEHYRGIDIDSLETVQIRGGALAYVSFRKHGKIYWTSKKVRLGAGERLLANGYDCIRARCGNRVSFVPRIPVMGEADREPTSAVFDTPEVRGMVIDDPGTGLFPFVFATPLTGTPLIPLKVETAAHPPGVSPVMPPGQAGSLPPAGITPFAEAPPMFPFQPPDEARAAAPPSIPSFGTDVITVDPMTLVTPVSTTPAVRAVRFMTPELPAVSSLPVFDPPVRLPVRPLRHYPPIEISPPRGPDPHDGGLPPSGPPQRPGTPPPNDPPGTPTVPTPPEQSTPEPATLVLCGIGLAVLLAARGCAVTGRCGNLKKLTHLRGRSSVG